MRRCPNPGCSFAVRHGFAAEVNDSVERCPSCDTPVTAPEPEAAPRSAVSGALLGRLAVFASLLVALLGFARLPIPGYQALAQLGLDTSFAALGLAPALVWLIGATVLIELGALLIRPARALRSSVAGRARLRGLAILLALAGLGVQAYLLHRGLARAPIMLEPPGLLRIVLTMAASLPVLLAVAAANDRWGLGHGVSLVVGGLVLHRLLTGPTLAADPSAALLLLALVVGLAIWLAMPSRATASGRKSSDGRPSELGLGLTIPSCGLIPALLVALIPMVRARLQTPADPGLALVHGAGLGPLSVGPSSLLSPIVELSVIVTLALAFAWLFTRPSLLVDRWRQAFPAAQLSALEREANGLFRRTALRSALLLTVLQLLVHQQLPGYGLAILAALLVDFASELRARSRDGELVAVELPSDLVGAEALAAALRIEQRPALIQGSHHRALYHGLGPWLPLRVLVGEADRGRAEQLVGAARQPLA